MDRESQQPLDLAAIKARLANSRGQQYWRTLGELAQTPQFMEVLANEVPQATRTMNLHMDRRQFLTLAGASLALAGLSGCRYLPQEKIVPYVRQPEELIIGIPLYYATAVPNLCGYGIGAIVTSREGRPIKIEGNPAHPDSLGATDAFMQAAILPLYDPDRSQVVMHEGDFSSWEEFYDSARPALDRQRATGGSGLRILTETVTSPTLANQLTQALAQFPNARWIQYEPAGCHAARAGSLAAFGEYVNTVYNLANAKRVVSLDSDFLLSIPGHVRYAHDFIFGRKIRQGATDMNRLYVIESTTTITGAVADHRLPVRASQVEGIARAIASRLGVDIGGGPVPPLDPETEKLVAGLVADLQANAGASAIIPGEYQSPAVHVLAHAINDKLGNTGKTVIYTDPVEASPRDQIADLQALVADMRDSKVDMLLILGGNPTYNAPADLDFATMLNRVPFRVHLSLFEDETSIGCQWHLPESHFMEAWGDIRAYDGTTSIIQPMIQPLYDSRSVHELLSGLFDAPPEAASNAGKVTAKREPRDSYRVVRDYWAAQGYPVPPPQPGHQPGYDFDFNRLLHDGVVPGTAAKTRAVTLKAGALAAIAPTPTVTTGGNTLEVVIRPDPTLWDGRHANNGWLQELPKPLSKVTWDNVALISPDTAARLNIPINEVSLDHSQGQPVIEVTYRNRKLTLPAWIQAGHPDDSITITLGYGRTSAGNVGSNVGVDIYPFFHSNALWGGAGTVTVTGDQYAVATTQHHYLMEGRDIIRAGTLTQFTKRPSLAPEEEAGEGLKAGLEAGVKNNDLGEAKDQPDLYPTRPWPKDPKEPDAMFGAYSWGMSIDVQSCISCNACMVACQAENNIPVVGKEQVMRGRHMNWIRIDTYYKSDPAKPNTYLRNPQTYFQPLPCMQCEQAPCEPVCPVGATMHSEEGLNQMVYNRCIGTRYCSNNCPYKVRRFNYLNFNNHFDIGAKRMLFNPEVTVRSRGVMEKCSYCVQRINFGRQKAKMEGRQLHDGEILTACQQACPTEAIVFGNISDKASKVYNLKTQPHNYGVLADLNTRPRTTYLGRVTNPNPDIEPETEQKGG